MPQSLHDLLAAAGFTDIEPLDLSAIPPNEKPADYIWRTGNLIAGVRERMIPPEQRDLDALIGLHMRGLREKCQGKFEQTLDRPQTIDGVQLRTAQATCIPDGKSADPAIIVAPLFYLTPDGVFSIFTHESPIAYKAEALAARDKLLKGLMEAN